MTQRQEKSKFLKSRSRGFWGKLFHAIWNRHPWITFKDACNLRSPQQHVGVIHSNLCTEITLKYQDDAVCNLGSINLPNHLNENGD